MAVAGLGLAHFTSPTAFLGVAERLFPENRRRGIYLTGLIEMICGVAMIGRKTRTVGFVGTIGYVAFLAGRLRTEERVPRRMPTAHSSGLDVDDHPTPEVEAS